LRRRLRLRRLLVLRRLVLRLLRLLRLRLRLLRLRLVLVRHRRQLCAVRRLRRGRRQRLLSGELAAEAAAVEAAAAGEGAAAASVVSVSDAEGGEGEVPRDCPRARRAERLGHLCRNLVEQRRGPLAPSVRRAEDVLDLQVEVGARHRAEQRAARVDERELERLRLEEQPVRVGEGARDAERLEGGVHHLRRGCREEGPSRVRAGAA